MIDIKHAHDKIIKTKRYREMTPAQKYEYIRKCRERSLKSTYRYKSHLYNAQKRNISNTITYEQFCNIIFNNKCEYCGEYETKLGIDRVDNSRGYDIDNIVPACWICNRMKGAMDIDNFIAHIQKISNKNIIS